jgi:hypothetical protein
LRGEREDDECRDINDERSLNEKWWETVGRGERNLHARWWL